MKRFNVFTVAVAMVFGSLVFASSASAQSLYFRSLSSRGGQIGHSTYLPSSRLRSSYYSHGGLSQSSFYGNQLRSASLGTVYQGYTARRSGYPSYSSGRPAWNDTTHLHHYGPSVVRYGSRYVLPGHCDVRRSPLDIHRH